MTTFNKAWGVVKVDFNSCVVCGEKEATTGYNERIACEDCGRPRRIGAHGWTEPAKIDCGSCGAESKAIMELMRCSKCGLHMCDECPGEFALCSGCNPDE